MGAWPPPNGMQAVPLYQGLLVPLRAQILGTWCHTDQPGYGPSSALTTAALEPLAGWQEAGWWASG